MALKDLVAQHSSLTEDAIEEIVAEYVRYDPANKSIVFTPLAANLQNRGKILVYLVALQGWPFVTDESIPVDAKPAEISEHVGVQGGTLRPILKELKDRHVIAERDGRYFVRPITLTAIKSELAANDSRAIEPKSRERHVRSSSRVHKDNSGPASEGATRDKKRSVAKKTGNLASRFESWIDEGFFDTPKTLVDVQRRFHKEGAIVPRTSVPGYLLKAVRSRRLTREEAEINKRRIWIYRRERGQVR